MSDLESVKKEYEEILTQLSDPGLISNWEKFEELTKKKGVLEKILEKKKELRDVQAKIKENELIIAAKEDAELVALAETEIIQLREKEKILEKDYNPPTTSEVPAEGRRVEGGSESHSSLSSEWAPIENLINDEEEKEETGPQSAIVEIRAGAGGKEASLFVGDIFRMYSKYAENQNWRQKILDSHPTELGGFKEIIFELKPARHSPEAKPMAGGDGDIFSKMKYEAGVHRVQRIPETEKSGRIHTSTASVAVLPKPRKAEIKIEAKNLKIDFYGASGPGGQYVQKRHTAVRITHLPSGIVITSQTERNQLQNKKNAMSILEAKLLEKKELEESTKISGKRRAQIGFAKRAEKIRTYNFPQDRITDHRIKKSWHNIAEIMAGRLDKIIEALEENLS